MPASGPRRHAFIVAIPAAGLPACTSSPGREPQPATLGFFTAHQAAVVEAATARIAPGPRDTGAALHRGLPVQAVVAQLFGTANDLARGRQAPGCVTSPRALNVLPASPYAATRLPHAAGVAWAMKMQKHKAVALAFLDAPETSAEESTTATRTRLSMASVYDVRKAGTTTVPPPSPSAAARSRGFGETRKISVDLAQIDRLRGVRRRRRSDAGRGFHRTHAVEAEVLRHPLDHRLVDAGGARDVPFEERVVAERVDDARRAATLQDGIVADVAPTILNIMGLQPPPEMTGHSLL